VIIASLGLGDADLYGMLVFKSLALSGDNLAWVIFRAEPQDYPSRDVGIVG
jgi:hypothetical protein